MADVKISALPAATTPLSGAEILPIVQGGVTTQVSVSNLTAARTVAASTINVDANTSTDAVRITQTGAGNALVVEDSANPDSTPFVVTTLGRVGVGTPSPIAILQSTISDGAFGFFVTGATRAVRFVPSSTAMSIEGIDNTGSASFQPLIIGGSDLRFATNNNERMRIDASGNVGIGTLSPASPLSVVSAVNGVARFQGGAATFVDVTDGTGTFRMQSTSAGAFIGAVTAVPLVFNTTNSERMRIDTSGNMLLGIAASPTTATQTFTIETGTAPTATPADTISIYSTDLSAGNTILSLYTEGTPVNANTSATPTNRIAVRINGTVYYLLASTSA